MAMPASEMSIPGRSLFSNGLNIHAGKLTYYAVGEALGIDVYSTAMVLRGA